MAADSQDLSELTFSTSEPLTLGVEVEVQLLDSETLDLKPSSPGVLAHAASRSDRIKAELFQSMLEINTGICKDAHEVRSDLQESIDVLNPICKKLGIRMASSGTHPFAVYNERRIYPAERYRELIDRNQWIAKRLMIFGLHVHVGMRSGEHAIQMNNALLHYLPLLLSFSASSPYWHGEDTELASSRITFFEASPTGGHPCSLSSWDDFVGLYQKLVRSGAIRSPKDIWWDIRPSPGFGTLEIRICDGLPTLAETVAITAFIHALSLYIDEQLADGRRFRAPPDWIMRENKWRASRHGLTARFIVNEEGDTTPLAELATRLFDELTPWIQKLGYQKEFGLLLSLITLGGSYQRQRQAAVRCDHDLKKLTDFLAREFENGAPIWFDDAQLKTRA